jgi:hypothetical protein
MASMPVNYVLPRPDFKDREAVLYGAVAAGEGVLNEDRSGAARLISTKLNTLDGVKFVAQGAASNAAGGYYIEVAHVAKGEALATANPSGYVRLGSISFNGTERIEKTFSGLDIEQQVKAGASPAITTPVRVVAIRLVAGTGTGQGQNGLAAPVNVAQSTGAMIHYQRA